MLREFGKKHLNDLFVLDGIQSVSARDRILREVVSNILVHRDYSAGTPSFDEGDVFKIMIPLKNIVIAKVGPNSESSTQDGTQNLQEMYKK